VLKEGICDANKTCPLRICESAFLFSRFSFVCVYIKKENYINNNLVLLFTLKNNVLYTNYDRCFYFRLVPMYSLLYFYESIIIILLLTFNHDKSFSFNACFVLSSVGSYYEVPFLF